MTQEEKAKAYDEALLRAKNLYKDAIDMGENNRAKQCEIIFPELKESEDEKIREDLIQWINEFPDTIWRGHYKKDILAWIENQGEQSIYNVPTREIILAIWDLGNEWKELTKGSISTKYGTQLNYIQNHWHESEYYLRKKKSDQKPNGIEYNTHTDDFIKKAAVWFNNHFTTHDEYCVMSNSFDTTEEMVEDFKNYING